MKAGYFQEANGTKSINRVMFAIGLAYTMLIAAVGLIWFNWTSGELIAVFSALAGVFYGGKLIQKSMEPKADTEPPAEL